MIDLEKRDIQDILDDMVDGFLDSTSATNEEYAQAQSLVSQAFCLGIDRKQAEITELKQKLASYENPDYVLVPREPTKEFIIGLASGCFSEDGSPWLDPEQSYREMLSAIAAVEKDHG